MSGQPADIIPFGDLLMYGGLSTLAALLVLSLAVRRWFEPKELNSNAS